MTIYYHYTDCAGFKGIISSKSIWLTHVNRKDDLLEATIPMDQFLSILDQFASAFSCVDKIKSMIDKETIDKLNSDVRRSHYAFSLTK